MAEPSQPRQSPISKILLPPADRLAVILLLVIAAAYFSPYLFTGKTPLPYDLLSQIEPWNAGDSVKPQNWMLSDVLRQYLPWRTLYRQALLQGELPLWNPYTFGGMPFLANHQSGVFYPFNLIFLLPNLETAALLFVVFHVVITGLGMYWLLRRLDLPPPAALAGSATWMLCGYLTVWLLWFTILATLAWLPWLFLAADRVIRQGSLAALGGLSLVVGLSLLGGHIQFAYYSLLAAGAFALWQAFTLPAAAATRFKRLGLFALGAVLGLAIALAQMAPTLELAGLGTRSTLPIQELMNGAIPTAQWRTLLVPNFFGEVSKYRGKGNFIEFTGYAGLVSLVFAALLVFSPNLKQKKAVWFFALLALGALHLAYGGVLNLALSALPGYTQFRGLQRFYSLWSFGAAGLVGWGVDALLAAQGWRRRWLALAGLGLAAVAGVALWQMSTILGLFIHAKRRVRLMSELLEGPAWLLLAAGVLILAVLVLARQQSAGSGSPAVRRAQRFAGLLAIFLPAALIAADLTGFARTYLPVVDAHRTFPQTPGIEFLQAHASEGRFARYGSGMLESPIPANIGIIYGLQDFDGYDSFTLDDYNRLVGLVDPGRYHFVGSYNMFGNFEDPARLNSPLLGMLGVAYLVTTDPLTGTLPTWSLAYSGADMTIYHNDRLLPPAFFVRQAQVLEDPEAQLAALASPQYDPEQVAFVSQAPPLPVDEQAEGRVHSIQRTLNTWTIEVDVDAASGQGALLVISQNDYPGWSARLDGSPLPLQTVNYHLKGVVLPAGQHTLALRFWPPRMGLLLAVSAAAALLGVGCALSPTGRRSWKLRRPSAQSASESPAWEKSA